MHDARTVANFFLDRARQRGMEVTSLTLLKVLYFAHGWYLAERGRPLVAQPFEAWKLGPVNRVVYDQLKGIGKQSIRQRFKTFDVSTCGYVDAPTDFDAETARFLNNIFDYYARFDAFTLVDLTHEPGSPWDAIWKAAEERAVPGMEIPDKLIAEWFREESQRMKRMQ